MVSQVVAIFLLLLSRPFPQVRVLAIVALWGVVGLTLVSGVDYFVRFWRDVVRSPARPVDETKPLGPAVEAGVK
jgi:phosphatidylglycerophosphate synthase